jgi:hypothetical protein
MSQQLLLRNNRVVCLCLLLLINAVNLWAGQSKKFSITIGYAQPLSYFETRKPIHKIGIGMVGLKYYMNSKYSIKISNRILFAGYERDGKIAYKDTSIIFRNSILTMLQLSKQIFFNDLLKVSTDIGFTNNINRNEYHFFYYSTGNSYSEIKDFYYAFGMNAGTSIEYKIKPWLSLGADLIFTKQFVNKLYQPNILITSLYFNIKF